MNESCTCGESGAYHWNTCPEYPDNQPYSRTWLDRPTLAQEISDIH